MRQEIITAISLDTLNDTIQSRQLVDFGHKPGLGSASAWIAIAFCMCVVEPRCSTAAEPIKDGASKAALASSAELPHMRLAATFVRTLPSGSSVYGTQTVEYLAPAWSADGTKLAAYSDVGFVISVWDRSGRVVQEFRRVGRYIGNSLTFAQGGALLITPPPEERPADVAFSVIDVASGTVVRDVPGLRDGQRRIENAADVFTATRDQQLLAVIPGPAIEQPVALYSLQDMRRIAVLSETTSNRSDRARALSFSADGSHLAVGRNDGRVLLYRTAERRTERTIDAYTDYNYTPASQVTFNHDSSLLAVGNGSLDYGRDDTNNRRAAPNDIDSVRIFRAETGDKVAALANMTQPIRALAWSPSGTFVVLIAGDQTVHLWSPLHPGQAARPLSLAREANSLAFSPDGRFLAIGRSGGVAIVSVNGP